MEGFSRDWIFATRGERAAMVLQGCVPDYVLVAASHYGSKIVEQGWLADTDAEAKVRYAVKIGRKLALATLVAAGLDLEKRMERRAHEAIQQLEADRAATNAFAAMLSDE